ncbi:CarboxypepD_reg-like domain-containing protein [Spirosomataceae bacterium TFI 002]|nr:CarboxypepD_reg-like domain-containing protein [Spirosomataceae bacterium TFI 002]
MKCFIRNRTTIKHLLLSILLIFSVEVIAQERLLQGIVKDLSTDAPLANVNVRMEGNTDGISTDSSGKYQLRVTSNYVIFSRIGYETRKFLTTNLPEEFDIYLKERTTELDEVVLTPGENPAWEIIRKLQENEPDNNPLKFEAFSADLYTKNKVFLLDSVSSRRTHLLFLENVGKVYLKNGQRKEDIEHSLQNIPRLFPLDLAFPNNLNPYGFYQPYFRFNPFLVASGTAGSVNERNYLNPLKQGSFSAYDFELIDTAYMAGDSVYHIIFLPKQSSSFDAMEGSFDISASDYALTHFKGITVDSLLVNRIGIEQSYQRVDGKWLPETSQVQIIYPLETKKDTTLLYFDLLNVFENPKLEITKGVFFDGATKNVGVKADTISSEAFLKLRPIALDSLEARIFDEDNHFLAKHPVLRKGLDKSAGVSKLIYQKGLVAGPVILSVEPSYTNFHERIRAGVAIQNNLTTQPRFDTRAYGVVGLQDRVFKYGIEANVLITKDRYNKIGFYHQKDLIQPGNVDYLQANYLMEDFPILTFDKDGYRVDMFQKTGVNLYFKPVPFTWFRLFAENENRDAINYEVGSFNSNSRRNYGMQFRFANKEIFNRVGLVEYLVNTNFPIVSVNVMQSSDLNSDGSFWSVDGEIKHQIRWKKLGYDVFSLTGGLVNGDVPYTYLYNTLAGVRETILGPSTGFQAGNLSNYGANVYFSLNYTHYFGRNLFRSKVKFFQPEPFVTHRFALGKIFNKQDYAGVQDFSNGLKEVGLGVNALLRIKVSSVYFSLGCYTSYNYTDHFDGKNRFRVRPTLRVDTF